MTKNRKTLILAMIPALTLSLALGGCGDDDKPEAVPSGSPSAPAASAKPAETKKELPPYTIKMFVPGGSVQKDQELVNQEVSKYLKDKINASFELTVIDWGSWQDKINLKFASNEPFDLLYTANWDNYSTKIQQGNIIPLNDLIDKFAPEAKKQLNPALLEGGKFNGKNYGFPVNKEVASQYGIMLRKDLVDKYKIDTAKIKTLEDLPPIFDMIKEKEQGVTPLMMDKGSTLINRFFDIQDYESMGGQFAKVKRGAAEIKAVNGLTSPEYKMSLDVARKWFLAGYVNKDAATLQDLNGALKAGKAFSYLEQLKPGKDAEVSMATGIQWVQVELTKPIISTSDTTGSMSSISRTSKDPERAMMFLNLLHTDKYLVNLIAFGIEGKHYVKKGDNIIDFPPGVDAKSSGYNLNQAWLYGNQFNDYLWASENPKKWENFKKFNDSAETSKVLGFIFDPANVKSEAAAGNNVYKEFTPGLHTGSVDPDEVLPKYIEKAKSVGIEKIIAETQRQLDEWQKANKK
ncbi:ABC transporter substrate-binding protein [Gorillibacterium sp. sgz5001074]|uniref:ABC transporter substrate-binding protein n=1 Tax=Gorillibacterium sp. sgz5001074 TaxID=3446695 RepID=UPI003F66CE33